MVQAQRWLPALLWMGLITYWSSQSNLPIDHPRVDAALNGAQHPLAHASAFGILAVLVWWACRPSPFAAATGWLLAAAFGALDEWHQSFTPGRAMEVTDWLVDAGAAAVAILAAAALHRVAPSLRRTVVAPVVSWPSPRLAASSAALLLVVSTLVVLGPAPKQRMASLAARGTAAVERIVPERVERVAERTSRRTMGLLRSLRNRVVAVQTA